MDNQTQYNLLLKSPEKLLTTDLYQERIKKTVLGFVKRGFFNYSEVDDITQELNELFLTKKMADLQKSYNAKYGLLIHYFARAVYNKCVDISSKAERKHQANLASDDVLEYKESNTFSTEKELLEKELITRESSRLLDYIRLFGKNKLKLKILLKVYSRVILITQDIKEYHPEITKVRLKIFLGLFGIDYNQKPDKTIYEEVTPLINEKENKNNSVDAVRKWLQEKINDIISELNNDAPFNYDKESLKNLVQISNKTPFSDIKSGM